MKNRIFIIIILSVFSLGLHAQTLEEIIDKHLKAHGDLAKWNTVKALALKGTFGSFSVEHPIYNIKTIDGDYYSDQHIGHHPVKSGFKDGKGWTIDPWHEFTYPRLVNKFEENIYHQLADYFTPFYKWEEKGYKLEYVGLKNEDGIECHVIKVERNGNQETWYLNAETYLEYKATGQWVDFGMPLDGEFYFDDFQEVDGLILPFFVERMFGQRDYVLMIESVQINPEYDEALFDMPQSDEMMVLNNMIGEWKVKVEMPGRGGNLRTIDQTKSKAKFARTNLIKLKTSYENYYVQPVTMDFSYHKGKGKYVLTTYTDFSSSMDLFEGVLDNGVIEFNEIITKGSDRTASFKCIVSDIKADGYVIEMQQSRDGENWMTAVKFTFSK